MKQNMITMIFIVSLKNEANKRNSHQRLIFFTDNLQVH